MSVRIKSCIHWVRQQTNEDGTWRQVLEPSCGRLTKSWPHFKSLYDANNRKQTMGMDGVLLLYDAKRQVLCDLALPFSHLFDMTVMTVLSNLPDDLTDLPGKFSTSTWTARAISVTSPAQILHGPKQAPTGPNRPQLHRWIYSCHLGSVAKPGDDLSLQFSW